jgi:hypothetical protein
MKAPIFMMGDPYDCEWFKEGRAATHDEVLEALNEGAKLVLQEAEEKGLVPETLESIAWVKVNLVPSPVIA